MHLTGKVSDFREMVERAASVVDAKSFNETLRAVRIAVDGSGVEVYGTDMVTGVLVESVEDKTPIKVEGDEPNVVCLPAAELVAALRANSGDFSLEVDDAKAKLICGSRYKLSVLDPEHYPVYKSLTPSDLATMSEAPNIGALLHNVSFATAKEAARYALNGVQLEHAKGKTTVVATDGFTAASSVSKKMGLEDGNAILPPTWCALVEKWSGDKTKLQLKADDPVIAAYMPTEHMKTWVFGSLLDGKFPECQGLFDRLINRKVTINVDEFKQALSRINFIGDDLTDPTVTLALLGDMLTLSTSDEGGQDAKTTVTIDEAGNGDELSVKFCPSGVSAMLNATGFDEMDIAVGDEQSPVLFSRKKYYHFAVAARVDTIGESK